MVRLLSYNLSKDSINEIESEGYTGFMYACMHGYTKIVKILSEIYKDVMNIEDKSVYIRRYTTGFTYACIYNHIEIVKYLLRFVCNDDINIYIYNWGTSFDYICRFGRIEILNILLEFFHGDEIKMMAAHNDNVSFLHACEYGHTKIVKILLAILNTDLKDEHIKKGFTNACCNNKSETVQLLLKLLQEKNIDVIQCIENSLYRVYYYHYVRVLITLRDDDNASPDMIWDIQNPNIKYNCIQLYYKTTYL